MSGPEQAREEPSDAGAGRRAGVGVEARGLAIGRPGAAPLAEGLDFHVAPGELLALVGPSGVGKSTLLDTIEGRLTPRAGRLNLVERGGARCAPGSLGGRLARVDQDLLLVGASSLEQNVLLGRLGRYPWWRTLAGFPRGEREAARALLARLGLGALWWKPAASVSGGERQRVALARALFTEPDLLLADEPTASLDEASAERAMALIAEDARRRGAGVVVVLHDLRLAERHAQRILRLGARA